MKTIPVALALTAALTGWPLAAQDTAAPAEAPAAPAAEGTAPDPAGLSMGQPVPPETQLGQPYVKEEFVDWQLRCIRTEGGNDPCQLYQLLKDAEDNSVAEFAIFPLTPAQGEAVAGGTIIAPLETLLTEGVRLQVDAGEGRRYPFTFCNEIGCFARVGYSAPDIAAFRAGNGATVTIVPVRAAGQQVGLKLSLRGFTAGYTALEKVVAEMAATPAPEAAPEGGN